MQPRSQYAIVKLKPPLGPSALKFVELQLANYLGPRARTLVTQAASESPGTQTLILTLADAVSNPSERDGFLTSCTYYLD